MSVPSSLFANDRKSGAAKPPCASCSNPLNDTRSCSSGSETCTSDRDLMSPSSIKSAQCVTAPHPLGVMSPHVYSSSAQDLSASPTRSILPSKLALRRLGDMASPRKSVVIDVNTPQVHHYQQEDTSAELSSHDSQADTPASPPSHKWNAMTPPQMPVSDLNDPPHSVLLSPPAPAIPPHSALSFESLLHSHSSKVGILRDSLDDEPFQPSPYNTLQSDSIYGLRDNSVSQLDVHLQDLHRESLNDTSSNIHRLTTSLNNAGPKTEDPVLALSGAVHLERHSSCLSDSSRQSLRQQDRSLTSSPVRSNLGQGVELNDGFRGLSDANVNALILPPVRAEYQSLDRSQPGSTYRNTEQSILKMLGPPVLLSLPELSASTKFDHPQAVKRESNYDEPLVFLGLGHSAMSHEIFVKSELDDEPRFFLDKPLSVDPGPVLVKEESEPQLFSDQTRPPSHSPVKEEFESLAFFSQSQVDILGSPPVERTHEKNLMVKNEFQATVKSEDDEHMTQNAHENGSTGTHNVTLDQVKHENLTHDVETRPANPNADLGSGVSPDPNGMSNQLLHGEDRMRFEPNPDAQTVSAFKLVAPKLHPPPSRHDSRFLGFSQQSFDQLSDFSDDDDNCGRGQLAIDWKGSLLSHSNLLINNAKMIVMESASDIGTPKLVMGFPSPRPIHEAHESFELLIRFHTDSAWKLENSNDGDREDNDDPRDDEDVTVADILPSFSNDLSISKYSDNELPAADQSASATGLPTPQDNHTLEENHSNSVSAKEDLPILTVHIPSTENGLEAAQSSDDMPKDQIPRELGGKAQLPDVEAKSLSTDAPPAAVSPSNANANSPNVQADSPSLAPVSPILDSFEAEKDLESSIVNDLSILDPGSPTKKARRALNIGPSDRVLANSSNIEQENEDFSLPLIDPERYLSLDEITRPTGQKSLEDLLSAEYDTVPARPLDYRTIWHLQARKEKSVIPAANKKYVLSTAQTTGGVVPSTLRPKSFRGVNVKSRRILSPNMDDYSVANFLPDLSQDSAFESHFNFLKRSNLSMQAMTNILPLLEEKTGDGLPVPSRATVKPKAHESSSRNHISPPPRKSRFSVPSFEIRRSASRLSPRDRFNDIFESYSSPPTIRSDGMKTLPSMERNDLRRILESRRNITQEEYKNLKLQKTNVKQFLVESKADELPDLLQEASIHATENETDVNGLGIDFAYFADEPVALSPENQFFGDYSFVDTQALEQVMEASFKNDKDQPVSQLQQVEKDWLSALKQMEARDFANVHYAPASASGLQTTDLHADDDRTSEWSEKRTTLNQPIVRRNSPEAYRSNNPFNVDFDSKKTNVPTKPILDPHQPLQSSKPTPTTTPQASPRKRNSPIKIGSPLKLVKQGEQVSVMRQSSPKRRSPTVNDQLLTGAVRDRPLPLFASPLEHLHESLVSAKGKSLTIEAPSRDGRIDTPPISRTSPDTIPTDNGRLFFRIMGLKSLALPDIEKHNAQISFSLDNGVHCIKTQNFPIKGPNAAIEKEFELTVDETLEFIVTLKCQWPKPTATYREVTTSRKVKSRSRIGRLFNNQETVTTTEVVPYTPVDSWSSKFANDGSFGRCYIDLNQYENKVRGKVCTFDVPCFNEWERGLGDKLLKTPPKIALLEVKMLYIPRTDADEQLPTSIRNANETLDRLRLTLAGKCEGYLYQEGGDCPTWKRRFFKLEGSSLIAHLEFTHKTRAKINLCKVIEVYHPNKERVKGAKRRDFSDGMLMDNSFKIKFADGESIEFGASNRTEMINWSQQFEEIIERNTLLRQPWVKLMIEAGLA